VNDGEISAAASELVSESRRVFSYQQSALAETRTIIDHQIDIAEDADNESLRIMRLNFIVIGAFVPIFVSTPELLAPALPWAVIALLFSTMSVFASAYIYRGLTLYGGFGDSPDLTVDALIEEFGTTEDGGPDVSQAAFQNRLLEDHQAGILHNNVEIKHRSEIHQQTTLLLLFAIVLLVLGILQSITSLPAAYRYLIYLGSVPPVVFGVHRSVRAASFICRLERRGEDEERLDYDYSFARDYPYISMMCSCLLSVYDPMDEE